MSRIRNLIGAIVFFFSSGIFACPVVDQWGLANYSPMVLEEVTVTLKVSPADENQVIGDISAVVSGIPGSIDLNGGSNTVQFPEAKDYTVTGKIKWKDPADQEMSTGPLPVKVYAYILKEDDGDGQKVPKGSVNAKKLKVYLGDVGYYPVNNVKVNFSEGTTPASATSGEDGIAAVDLKVDTAAHYTCNVTGATGSNVKAPGVTFDETVFSIEITSPTERKYIARPADGQTTEFDVTYSIKPEGFTASRGYLYLTDRTGGGSMGDLDPLSGEGRMTCSVSSDDKLDNYKLSAKVYSDQNLEAKSSNDQTITIFGITTETEATVPIDRSRKKIGVGEKVILFFEPTGLGSVKWSMTGEGAIMQNSDNSISLYTIASASNPSITASVSNYTCTVTFNVIVPNGVRIYQEPGTGIKHIQGVPSVGFIGRPYILPADVSFYNIEIRESAVNGIGKGYFAYDNLLPHEDTGEWIPMLEAEEGYGTKVDAKDTIQGWSDEHTPYEDGTFTWPIPWLFQIGSGSKEIAKVNHFKTIDKTGKVTIRKNSDTFSKELNDPSSNY